MNYAQSYKNVVHGQPFYEGARTTAGILIPALLMGYFNELDIGILLSLGAMCVSITDSQGPIHHRKNGMLACILSIFLVTICIGFASHNYITLGLAIIGASFFFSMLNIYGARAGAIGISSLLILVLNLDKPVAPVEVIYHALYIASGGLWYMCFSILLYNVRPYKLAQQVMGDCMQSIADYLRLRATFYNKQIDYDSNYRKLLVQQAIVQDKQSQAAELLFKTTMIAKETTTTGRVLVIMYLDMADMLEQIMTSYQHYRTLHEYFDEYDILADFQAQALLLANEIEEIGTAIKTGATSVPGKVVNKKIKETRERYEALRADKLNAANIEGFISLRRILENIEDIYTRVQTLHKYTTYDQSIRKKDVHAVDYEQLVSHQEIRPQMLVDNLSLKSENFRHALRVTTAMLVGYVGSLFFTIGHSYWILLTIIVILKPAYGLTQTRNVERLLGTVIGLVLGIIIVYLVHHKTALLLIMILLMLGTYMFLRQRYLLSVILMTPYIIIFFHLLNPAIFRSVLADRLIDTLIGSGIAFAANKFVFPAFEHEKIKASVLAVLQSSVDYFMVVTGQLSANIQQGRPQAYRKNALVNLANISDVFSRMMSEPKRQQKGIEHIHRFVVLCHTLMSHIATLSFIGKTTQPVKDTDEVLKHLASLLGIYLNNARLLAAGHAVEGMPPLLKEKLRAVNDVADQLVEQRQQELLKGIDDSAIRQKMHQYKAIADQYTFIYHLTADLHKACLAIFTAPSKTDVPPIVPNLLPG